MKPEILAIVPARSGSKGVPGKNIRLLNRHPLLAYSVAAGACAPSISRVICSTDSEEIGKIAVMYGAEVPFLRPVELSLDNSLDIDAFIWCLNWLEKKEGYIPDLVVQLRPTSPIRFLCDLENSIRSLIESPLTDSVRSVGIPPVNPYKIWTIDELGFLSPLLSLKGVAEPYNSPRQELPETWAQTGSIEVIRTEVILSKKSMTGERILPYILNKDIWIDIDSETSLMMAEKIIQNVDCIKP
jgi:CMP-N,N'-diacetyllegionaminic acid synthase